MSGSFRGDLAVLRARMNEVAAALRAHGLMFEPEVQGEHAEDSLVVRDAPADGDDKAVRRSLSVTLPVPTSCVLHARLPRELA